VKSGNIARAFLTEVLGLGGMALGDLTAPASNTSLPVDLVEFKRLLNGTLLSHSQLRDVVRMLEAVANARAGDGKLKRVSRLSQKIA